MGFQQYARSILFEKEQLKKRALLSKSSQGEFGFLALLPEPEVNQEEDCEKSISLMGYHFPADSSGKRQLMSLFRAAVFLVNARALFSNPQDYEEWRRIKNSRLAKFTISLIEDMKARTYLSRKHRDKLADLAFANILALSRLGQVNQLMNPATKVMAGLLIRTNTGIAAIKSEIESEKVGRLAHALDTLRNRVLSLPNYEEESLKEETLKVANEIYSTIEDSGPIIDVPFLPHTEECTRSSVFHTSHSVKTDLSLTEEFKRVLRFLEGSFTNEEAVPKTSEKIAEAGAIQAFSSWEHEKEKDRKIAAKYEDLLQSTRFKSAEIPRQGYAEYLEAKSTCKSEAHRLVESLLVARDAIDEDPRKPYGVLDLQDVIQVIASKSPRMDIFMLDENISKSYAWSILLDTSRSLSCVKTFALQLFVMLAEAANRLLLDPGSWGMYAFNDRFFIVKDLSERYNMRVKSRIGGLKFEGFTYLPDALKIGGQILKNRNENLKLMTVISDGWPFGYPNIEETLSETIDTLERRNIALLGIGAQSTRMELFFKKHCTVYTLRDLKKKFSTLYMESSRIAAEA